MIDFGFSEDRVYAFSETFNGFQTEESMQDGLNGSIFNISNEYIEMVETIKSEEFEPYLRNRMNNCIKSHQELLNYCKLLNEFFGPLLLPCLSFALFYIIFIAFTLLVSVKYIFTSHTISFSF